MEDRSAPLVLDVRPMIARERHELIFRYLDRLAVGERFVLINDHDPKPLYYQLMAERPGAFAWDSRQTGPMEWTVTVSRLQACEPLAAAALPQHLPHISPKTPLRYLAARRPETIAILARLGITIPSEGRDSIAAVAAAHQIDIEQVMSALELGLAD
jgi:uncharacterized protein (DUF2249 family)